MSDINNNLNQQAYSAGTDETSLKNVANIICVLMPRALMVAGFDENGELQVIRNSDYKSNLPAWILDFYEHQFINEPLLAQPNNVTAAYVATDKNCIIPADLFERNAAMKWMQNIHFIENNEVITTHPLSTDRAQYVYAFPDGIKGMLTRYFPMARVMPFAAGQFHNQGNAANSIQCYITNDTAFASLRYNNTLQWHQAFAYENAEDIAYQLKLACQQANIDSSTLPLQCHTTGKGLAYVARELANYFPVAEDTATGKDNSWAETIQLLQQLYACAS